MMHDPNIVSSYIGVMNLRLKLPESPVLPIPPKYNPLYTELPKYPSIADYFESWYPHFDVVRRVFEPLGFEVLEYPMPQLSSSRALDELLRLLLDMVVFSLIVYPAYYVTSSLSLTVRRMVAMVLMSMLMAWPLAVGVGMSMLMNYLRPALAFRSSLIIWDIFCIREPQEVLSWSFELFEAHLWFFPYEKTQLEARYEKEGIRRNPRIESLKRLPLGFAQMFLSFFLTLFFPPWETISTMRWYKFHLYCIPMSVGLWMVLAAGGSVVMNTYGVIFGIEQQPMFANPFSTGRLRDFWSRWNRAIATVLHRVIFGGRNTYKTRDQRACAEKAKGHSHPDARKKESNKSPSAFLRKSCLALVTFFVSGLFHEYLLYYAIPKLHGPNTLFFVINGVATIVMSAIELYCPEFDKRIPIAARLVMFYLFALITTPLFFLPFQAGNFFASIQQMMLYSLPSSMSQTNAHFVYLFGR